MTSETGNFLPPVRYAKKAVGFVNDLLGRPLARFIRFWVLRQGFRLGKPGLFVAVTAALYAHLKYAKLDERTSRRVAP